jgi:hypothetical protein
LASQNVKPQLSDQFSLGYFRNLDDNNYEFSAEIYYKNLQDVVDFKDHANLLGNSDFEQELRFGKGQAYGLELMLKKNSGKLTGWVSYTFGLVGNRQIIQADGEVQKRTEFLPLQCLRTEKSVDDNLPSRQKSAGHHLRRKNVYVYIHPFNHMEFHFLN